MGGSIFTTPAHDGASPALYCPRMPPPIYRAMHAHAAVVLKRFFSLVATPPEAPSKVDHGDVDFNVQGGAHADQDQFRQLLPELSDALGATRHASRGPSSVSFAVPWPGELNERDGLRTSGMPSDILETVRHAQLDVTLCATADELQWTTFQHAYGDLWQIGGMALRPLGMKLHPARGLVLADRAIAELDHANPVGPTLKKRARAELDLSMDPDALMRFLGLDVEAFTAGFANERALFDWIAHSRLLSRDVFEHVIVPVQHGSPADAEPLPPGAGSTSRSRRGDRDRRQKRQSYVRFVDEYLTENPCAGCRKVPSREEAIDQAVDFFGKRAEREAQLEAVRAARAETDFWYAVKERIPREGDSLNGALRALRRWVVIREVDDDVMGPVIVDHAELDATKHQNWWAESGMDQGALLSWIDEHWEECKTKEKARVAKELEARRAAKQR